MRTYFLFSGATAWLMLAPHVAQAVIFEDGMRHTINTPLAELVTVRGRSDDRPRMPFTVLEVVEGGILEAGLAAFDGTSTFVRPNAIVHGGLDVFHEARLTVGGATITQPAGQAAIRLNDAASLSVDRVVELVGNVRGSFPLIAAASNSRVTFNGTNLVTESTNPAIRAINDAQIVLDDFAAISSYFDVADSASLLLANGAIDRPISGSGQAAAVHLRGSGQLILGEGNIHSVDAGENSMVQIASRFSSRGSHLPRSIDSLKLSGASHLLFEDSEVQGNLELAGNATARMSAGAWRGLMTARNDARITIAPQSNYAVAYLDSVNLHDQSSLAHYGHWTDVRGYLTLDGSARARLSRVINADNLVILRDQAELMLSEAVFVQTGNRGNPSSLRASNSSRLFLTNMEMYPHPSSAAPAKTGLVADDDAAITLFAKSFLVDGFPVGFGPLEAETGNLSGVNENGTPFSFLFERGPSSTIRLIPSVAGDLDGNAAVDQGDLDLVLLNWGADAAHPPRGWIHNLPTGSIDQDDLDRVLLNWGAAPLALQGASVPEPGSFGLFLVALFALRRRIRNGK